MIALTITIAYLYAAIFNPITWVMVAIVIVFSDKRWEFIALIAFAFAMLEIVVVANEPRFGGGLNQLVIIQFLQKFSFAFATYGCAQLIRRAIKT